MDSGVTRRTFTASAVTAIIHRTGLLPLTIPFAFGQSGAPAPKPEPTWVDSDRSVPRGMRFHTFFSKSTGGEVSYLLYLPPAYEESPQARYPVVYWLHGLNGSQRSAASFVRHLDAAIRERRSPAMIAVSVNGMRDSRYVDSYDGKYPVESMIVKDLIPHIDRTYRTINKREARAIEGFSMGGFGAAHMGFKYPHLFGLVSIVAGALLDDGDAATIHPELYQKNFGANRDYYHSNSPWVLVEKNTAAIRGRMAVRILVGDQDRLLERNRNFSALLSRLRISHHYLEIPSVGHELTRLYDQLDSAAFDFYSGNLPR
ncbi:MAG: esterase family protein [Bryobacterales bacterium]|nr:esterase family protein [Bryobacterales bacterium]